MKRFISVLLMLCLMLGMFTMTAFADEYYAKTQTDFESVLATAVDGSVIKLGNGEFTMPSSVSASNLSIQGAGEDATKISFPEDYVENSGISFEGVFLDKPANGGSNEQPPEKENKPQPPKLKSIKSGGNVAELNGTGFASIQAAVDAAQSGDTIKVIASHTVDGSNVWSCSGVSTVIGVSGRNIMIDLNACEVTIDMKQSSADAAIMVTDGSLVLKDSGGNGAVRVYNGDNLAYMLLCYTGGTMEVQSGSYTCDKVSSALIYSQESETVKVIGGNYNLGNIGTGENGSPWIFNAKGQNNQHIWVTGGTFNADVYNQYWRHEVQVPNDKTINSAYAIRDNGDGTYTVVPANAAQHEDVDGFDYLAGYDSLDKAVEAANNASFDGDKPTTIIRDTVLNKSVTANHPIVVAEGKELSIDLKGNELKTSEPIEIGSDAVVTIKGEGSINSGAASIDEIFSNATAKNLNIAGGVWSFNPSKYLADGAELEQLPDGRWKVILPPEPVAKVNSYSVPATADNSNMPLWSCLFILFAASAILTGKKRRS